MENDLLDAPVAGVEIRDTLADAERKKLLEYAINLLTTGFSEEQIHTKLVNRGCSPETATGIMMQVKLVKLAKVQVEQIQKTQKGNPTRDIIVGGLFLFGGLIGTFAGTGYIFTEQSFSEGSSLSGDW